MDDETTANGTWLCCKLIFGGRPLFVSQRTCCTTPNDEAAVGATQFSAMASATSCHPRHSPATAAISALSINDGLLRLGGRMRPPKTHVAMRSFARARTAAPQGARPGTAPRQACGTSPGPAPPSGGSPCRQSAAGPRPGCRQGRAAAQPEMHSFCCAGAQPPNCCVCLTIAVLIILGTRRPCLTGRRADWGMSGEPPADGQRHAPSSATKEERVRFLGGAAGMMPQTKTG